MVKGNKLNELALGYASATVSGLGMLLLGIGWNTGLYVNAAEQMAKWHIFFSPSISGIIGGVLEGAVWGFVIAYLFAWVYNKFV